MWFSLQEMWQANIKKLSTNIVYLKDDYVTGCEFFMENNLISKNQSGFRPGDSCQLLSITHESYKSFDDTLKVRAVFLDLSKAFHKVWHKDLILKLKQNCT